MVRTRRSNSIARSFSAPLPALAMLAIGAAAHAQPVLPVSGTVIVGNATISASGSSSLTVTQGSARAIVDWNGFSVGQGGSVRFDNGAGATLNRVRGAGVSKIDGLLSASGSIYLINPNGVVIGKSGVVDVGGSFVASALDVADGSFIAGGDLDFAGGSGAAVINLGKVGALGGDVALIASRVENRGTITAANGTVGLAAGTDVLLRDAALDGGKFVVHVGGAGTSATNAGTIAAAAAELRTNGGNVYALAGDTAGAISATGVAQQDGRIFLIAGGDGTVAVAGTLTARGADGMPGFVETSGGTVQIGAVSVDAGVGGTWLVDPSDLTIDEPAATAISASLNAGTNVREASLYSQSASGDLVVTAPISWSTTAALTLDAARDLRIGSAITISGGGTLALISRNTTRYANDVQIQSRIFEGGSVQFTGVSDGAVDGKLTLNGGPIALYRDLSSLANAIAASPDGIFGLAVSVDGSNGGQGYSSSPIASLSGTLLGLGNAVRNLTVNAGTTPANVGLIGSLIGSVRELSLLGGNVIGSGSVNGGIPATAGAVGTLAGYSSGIAYYIYSSVTVAAVGDGIGGLIGVNQGSIYDSRAIGDVTGRSNVGGLIGENVGGGGYGLHPIVRSSAAGTVTATWTSTYPNGAVGGLVGRSGGAISDSYATGNVFGAEGSVAGGLVGAVSPPITPQYAPIPTVERSYATGSVMGTVAGGVVGRNYGSVSDSYYDASTFSGVAIGETFGGTSANVVALGGTSGNSAFAASSYSSLDLSAAGPWAIVDGATRPILRNESAITITNAHQLQLAAIDPTASHALGADVDLAVTANVSDVWNSVIGFAPIGSTDAPFTGTFRGNGYTISNLFVARGGSDNVGLFGGIGSDGAVSGLTLANAFVTGRTNVGGIAGFNLGTVSQIFTSGTVRGGTSIGGVIGYNLGTITSVGVGTLPGSIATTYGTDFIGGLVGYNAGSLSGSATGSVGALGSYAGGLAGYNDRQGTVSGAAYGNISAHDYAGGVAGFSSGTIGSGSAGGIVCATRGAGGVVGFNTGVVTAVSASAGVRAADLAGGFVGVNFGTIANQSAAGSVNGGTQLGGFAGANASGGTLTAVSASGPVEGTGTLGGLVGYNDGGIVQSSASGAVGGSNAAFVGGLVGYNALSIASSYATGRVTGNTFIGGLAGYNDTRATIANAGATGRVSGVDYAGGLAGYNGGTIDSANTNGIVAASGRGAGGLVGYNVGTVVHAYALGSASAPTLSGGLIALNSGQVTLSFATGPVTGGDTAGGLVGYNAGMLAKVYATGSVSGSAAIGGLVGANNASVADAYATGAVTGTDAARTGGLVGFADTQSMIARGYAAGAVSAGGGGVAGTNMGMLAAAFYDAGTTTAAASVDVGQASGTAAVGGTSGRSASGQASYPGLDFASVWTIQQGSSRPYLRDNPQAPAPQ